MNIAPLVFSIVVMVSAIVIMVVSDRIFDTSTTRQQAWLVLCIVSELVAFEYQSWILCLTGVCFLIFYIFTPHRKDTAGQS